MRKIISSIVLILLLTSVNGYAMQDKRQKKKREIATSVKEQKESDYQKIMKDVKLKSISSFLSVYRNDKNKIYLEIPFKFFNRGMLLGSTLSEISEAEYGDVGYKEVEPMLITFSRNGNNIILEKISHRIDLDENDLALKEAFDKNNINSIKEIYKIEAFNHDSTAVIIDITKLISENTKDLEGLKDKDGLVSYTYNYVADRSFIDSFKAFDDNLSIKTVMSYKLNLKAMGMTLLRDHEITCKVTRSFLLLPEEAMKMRVSDSRVGIFFTGKRLLTTASDGIKQYTIANRWRLEPVDEQAHRRGELTEVKKPIVFYIDPSFPENWRASVKSGVERWNLAFEKIGFKNAIQAKDFPKDDPTFDPDNLKYSCVRYIPKAVANAMGPSWVDPRTGEIINASVLIYNDLITLINRWRFVQTSQIDSRVRVKKMPQDIVEESISYAIAHEIGHCLGFMHNMASSAAYSVEDLRNAEFTQKYGTTASIMDYARYNYVAQQNDKGIKLTPPDLGVWDYFTIKWNYKPVYDMPSIWEEAKVTESWVDEHSGDPMYRYGRQQYIYRIDPSAVEEDLGDDPIKAGQYGIKNLKYILKNLNQWFPDDLDYSYRNELYLEISSQYYRYLINVMNNVGGIYLTETKIGTNAQPIIPLAADVQKKSLQWVLNEINNSDWIDDSEIVKYRPLGVKVSENIKAKMTELICSKTDYVLMSSYYADKPYGVREYLNDLYNYAFGSLIKNKRTTNFEIKLQKMLIENAIYIYNVPKGGGKKSLSSYLIDNELYSPIYIDKVREYIKTKEGGEEFNKYIENELGQTKNYLRIVNVTDIDDSDDYYQQFVVMAQKLINLKLNILTDTKEKAHYMSILNQLNRSINKSTTL